MGILEWIALGFFGTGFGLIIFEHKVLLDKAATAIATGVTLWVMASFSVSHKEDVEHHLAEAFAEIFGIIIFLGAAMSLVAVLVNHRFFDLIRARLNRYHLTDKPQFIIIGILTFFLSAVLDNLTITLVMSQIALRFFRGKNLLIAISGIIILANAGGAWSPLGDVTTIMLWLAEKFTPWEVVSQGFFPSVAIGLVAMLLLLRKMDNDSADTQEEEIVLSKGEKLVISVTLLSFGLPFVAHLTGLHPVFGLLAGWAIVMIVIHFLHHRTEPETRMEKSIKKFLDEVDHSTLWFFLGILLAVSALGTMGVLEHLSTLLLGEEQASSRVIGGSIGLGLLSALVDNVPLTALAIDMITVPDPALWVLLAITVGTGGSVLLIGSAAGVIAMGIARENNIPLTVPSYFKIAFVPALLSYFVGVGVWGLQYWLTA